MRILRGDIYGAEVVALVIAVVKAFSLTSSATAHISSL